MASEGTVRILVDLNDKSVVISSPRQVVVRSEYDHEHNYSQSVMKYIDQSVKRSEQYEIDMAIKREKQALGDSHYVQRFLQDALVSSESKNLLRRSNFMSRGTIRGSMGWALDDLFQTKDRGTEMEGLTGNMVPTLDRHKEHTEERDILRGRGGPKAMRGLDGKDNGNGKGGSRTRGGGGNSGGKRLTAGSSDGKGADLDEDFDGEGENNGGPGTAPGTAGGGPVSQNSPFPAPPGTDDSGGGSPASIHHSLAAIFTAGTAGLSGISRASGKDSKSSIKYTHQ